MAALKYLSVHAHFYQPPREDPRTGEIPIEKGAAPFPNWNEKIYQECYRPNAELGNFEKISFNIGPTLCEWLEITHPETLRKIIHADQAAIQRDGVGNAMAQPYHHTILPLMNYQDKVTQVRWGIADFETRFGRKPTGMWLPETAVDTETLQVLAEHGIGYTILAPWQARSKNLDVRQPYRVVLPNGASLVVFFYHAGLSGGISFNPQLTTNADIFAQEHLLPAYSEGKTTKSRPALLMLATDGELYGHHQPLRDYFLQRLLTESCQLNGLQAITPAKWLKEYPPRKTVHIRERTSWSCHHGIKRWSSGCACTPGDSSWKKHFFSALRWIAREMDRIYVEKLSPYFEDPWEIRHAYIRVMSGQISASDYVDQGAGQRLSPHQRGQIVQLLEAQLERQRMFASCGWFFEDYDRIEPRNATAYAAHAVRLTAYATGIDLSAQAMKRLAKVVSSRSGLRGDQVFQTFL